MRGMKYLLALLCLAAQHQAWAQEAVIELPLATTPYIRDYESFKLAANDAAATSVKRSGNAAPEIRQSDFEPPLFSGSNAHKYLGLATMVGAILTGSNHPPENECETAPCPPPQPRETNGTHAKLARATVALAAATVVTGLVAHWDDFHLEDGITDPDNLHALLGTAGMLTMAYAVSKATDPWDSGGHAGKAIAGAAMMAVAIKITW